MPALAMYSITSALLISQIGHQRPCSYEIMTWDEEAGRWEGIWRHVEGLPGEPDMSRADPVCYFVIPDADDTIVELCRKAELPPVQAMAAAE
jgi:hypothetical protein